MTKRAKSVSAKHSRQRIVELEQTLEILRQRQADKPTSDVHGRMVLALLIEAVERSLERTKAVVEEQERK